MLGKLGSLSTNVKPQVFDEIQVWQGLVTWFWAQTLPSQARGGGAAKARTCQPAPPAARTCRAPSAWQPSSSSALDSRHLAGRAALFGGVEGVSHKQVTYGGDRQTCTDRKFSHVMWLFGSHLGAPTAIGPKIGTRWQSGACVGSKTMRGVAYRSAIAAAAER